MSNANPSPTTSDLPYSISTYSVSEGRITIGHPDVHVSHHLAYNTRCELSGPYLRMKMTKMSTFINHVLDVLFLRPLCQMTRPDTGWSITSVKNLKPGIYRTVDVFVYPTVCIRKHLLSATGFAANKESSIASRQFGSSPKPTTSKFRSMFGGWTVSVNKSFEAFDRWCRYVMRPLSLHDGSIQPYWLMQHWLAV